MNEQFVRLYAQQRFNGNVELLGELDEKVSSGINAQQAFDELLAERRSASFRGAARLAGLRCNTMIDCSEESAELASA